MVCKWVIIAPIYLITRFLTHSCTKFLSHRSIEYENTAIHDFNADEVNRSSPATKTQPNIPVGEETKTDDIKPLEVPSTERENIS